jgi:transposase
MARALSEDLRRRVVCAVDDGMSCRAAAARFGVGVSSAIRWVAQRRRVGHVQPRKPGGDQRSYRIDGHGAAILSLLDDKPDVTLEEIAAHVALTTGYRPSVSVVHRFFERHRITRKKRRRTPPNKSGRT